MDIESFCFLFLTPQSVDRFESFLANKYAAAKRFGLEGCETLVPGMKALIDHAAELGMETVCIGMPHRGGDSQLRPTMVSHA